MMKNILTVDDEKHMLDLVQIYLRNEGYRVEQASSGVEAIELIKDQHFDAIILDVMMPDMDGWEVCTFIRKKDTHTAILMLTAKSNVEFRVKGLELGADDYLIKPFAPEELVARVKSLLRRKEHAPSLMSQNVITIGDLVINKNLYQVKVAGTVVELTAKEFDILYLLAKKTDRVFTRENIIDQIWSVHDYQEPRTVDSHIKNIRIKLHKGGLIIDPIKTVWGIGYKFNKMSGIK